MHILYSYKMKNNKYKIPQSSTPGTYFDLRRNNSETILSPTPMVAQQTPQMMPQTAYYSMNNYTSPIPDITSPNLINKTNSLDFLHQPSNLQMYNSNMASSSPNNYGNAQTPAMNLRSNDKRIRANTPLSPNLMRNLAGTSPALPNNVTVYRSQNNINMDKQNTSSKNNSTLDFLINFNDIRPTLQNIVSTSNLGCELNLRQIALQAKNAEYNPKRFAAIIMRIKEPKTTALIFSSGKMVCTGAKSEEDSKKASRKYAKIIRSLGFQVDFKDFKVQNIVGSCDVKFQIALSQLNRQIIISDSQNIRTNNYICHYEPEIFPGLIYHMLEPEIVLLIFVSGKIVLTGAKQREQIYEAFRKIYPLLLQHKHGNKNGKSNKDLHQEEVKKMKEFKSKNNGQEQE